MKSVYFFSAYFFGFLTTIYAVEPANTGCLEKEKHLILIETADNILTKAKNTFPSCKEDVNSKNGSECAGQMSLAYIELAKKIISDSRKYIPTCTSSKPIEKDDKIVEKEKDDKIVEKEKDDKIKEKEKDDKIKEKEKDDKIKEKEKDDKIKEKEKDDKIKEKEKDDKIVEDKKEDKIVEEEKDDKIVQREKLGNCLEILARGHRESGYYRIWGEHFTTGKSLEVYCDMESDTGGWTLIQRRGHFPVQVNFQKDWKSYRHGFGNVREEFWLGNENIRVLCHKGCQLRVDLQDEGGIRGYGLYESFSLSGSNYRLKLSGFKGDIGDIMHYNSNFDFSTKDRGNTQFAQYLKSGWWHASGNYYCNLNGLYLPGQSTVETVHWYTWRDYKNLASVEMKIRPSE